MKKYFSIEDEIFHRIRVMIVIGSAIFLLGTLGYMIVEKWSFLDSLYMTVTTLATVGFGEVHTLSNAGRLFTIVLILFGLGGFAYVITNITGIIVEGHIHNYFKLKNMEHKIAQLEGHIVLCGYGRVGKNVVEVLDREKTPFVIIEKQESACEHLLQSGYLVIKGDSTEDRILEKAGIKNAYGLIAALDSDINNLFLVMSARKLNPKLFIVARVEQDGNQEKIITAGANRVVSPAQIGGYRLAATMIRPEVVNFLDVFIHHEGIDLSLHELKIAGNSALSGKTIKESQIPRKVKIVGLKKENGEVIVNPDFSTILKEDHVLILFGENSTLKELTALGTVKGIDSVQPLE